MSLKGSLGEPFLLPQSPAGSQVSKGKLRPREEGLPPQLLPYWPPVPPFPLHLPELIREEGRSLTGGSPDPHLTGGETEARRGKGTCSKPPGGYAELSPTQGADQPSPGLENKAQTCQSWPSSPAFKFWSFSPSTREPVPSLSIARAASTQYGHFANESFPDNCRKLLVGVK